MDPRKLEVVREIETVVAENLKFLRSVKDSWQPLDYLPDSSATDWFEQVREIRRAAEGLSDELLVVLVGDTITEEALPSYQTALNRLEGMIDPSGTSDRPFALWSRGWTAEENRHGDLLKMYLYLTGRVDMRAVETTTQHLIRNGFNMKDDRDPYKAFIYTSFQERATKVSHANCGKLAESAGDSRLRKICSMIASDEARHESAYKAFMGAIFRLDPEGAIVAFRDMMKTRITMPASQMDNSEDGPLFGPYATVAQRLGVYTLRDYADIVEHLVSIWEIAGIPSLQGDAARAQEDLCGFASRYRQMADRFQLKSQQESPKAFSWIFGRSA